MRHGGLLAALMAAAWLGACAPLPKSEASPAEQVMADAPVIQRAVYAGARQRFDFLTTLRPDCTYMGPSDYRFLIRPQHGLIEFKPTHEPPAYLQGSIYFKCNDHNVSGVTLYYTADRGYAGEDRFVMQWISPAGLLYRRQYVVTVQ